MAWAFGDSFDLYSNAANDLAFGYWDSVNAIGIQPSGRFPGSRAMSVGFTSSLVKASNVNDQVHHLAFSMFYSGGSIGGTGQGFFATLYDGATAQCSIVFLTSGAVQLYAGANNGTLLATSIPLILLTNTWYAIEIELVISATNGGMTIRKNGNPANDYTVGGLNTQATANAYANKLQIGGVSNATPSAIIDDFFWQSLASPGSWLGDMRCYTRMPATDIQKQFTPLTTVSQLLSTTNTSSTRGAGNCNYSPFVSNWTGTITSITFGVTASATAHIKAAIYASNGIAPTNIPGAVLGTSTEFTNPITGTNTIVFGTPVPIVKGQTYFVAIDQDATVTYNANSVGVANVYSGTTAYASFPAANPSGLAGSSSHYGLTFIITPTVNNEQVAEPQEDGLATYVFDSNPGDADFYGIASIPVTPAVVYAVVTRMYAIKSDAGTRTTCVQMKSGGVTVQSPTIVLTTSNWTWAWRTDTTDPNTGAAWTPAAVNTIQIGPKVIA
jgi:hypothetical protein